MSETAALDRLLVNARKDNAPWVFKGMALVFPLAFLLFAFVQVAGHWYVGLFIWCVLTMTFAVLPATHRSQSALQSIPWYDWSLIAISTFISFYFILDNRYLIDNVGAYTEFDLAVMITAVLISLEAARRSIGIVVPTLAVMFMIYVVWLGFPSSMLLTRIYVGDGGMFGTITDVFARYVLLFFIFGAVMERAGAAEFLQRYLHAVAGKVVAGSAKGCIFGSGFLGMLIGSTAGNIAVTGSLTIPMMKREGFTPEKAAGIEVASSLGGELSPPVMGSAAFLIVANTGVPYRDVALISIFPAVLYYLTIYLIVHFEGRRDRRKLTDSDTLSEKPRSILLEFAHLILAPIALVAIIALGYSPTFAAAGGTLTAIALSQLQRSKRITPSALAKSLIAGSFNFVSLGATAPILGIVLVSVLLIGLPTEMSSWAISLAGGQMYLVLIGVFLLALVLGMGMPIVAAYMILAIVAGPALGQFAIPMLTAHLFVMWYAQTAAIHPPVGLACYMASIIAGAGMWRTFYETIRLAIAMMVVPIMMVYGNIVANHFPDRLIAFGLSAMGFSLWAAFVVGYVASPLGWPKRILMLILIVGLCVPYLWINAAAFSIGVAFFILEGLRPQNPILVGT